MNRRVIDATDTVRELLLWYVLIVFVTGSVYMIAEHKSLLDSLWWAVVTAMTVGYGDTYPTTIVGRVDAVVLMHIVPLILLPLITARLASTLIVNNDAFTHEEQEEIRVGIREIREHLGIGAPKK